MKIKLPPSEVSEIPKELAGVCNKTYIPLMEPVREKHQFLIGACKNDTRT